MAEWWTSDSHFGHRNIIKYCDRPFKTMDGQPDMDAMNRALTERWNEVVGPGDTVFHVGDFSLANVGRVRDYRKKLNGRVVLIRGNHDHSADKMLAAGFDEVHKELYIERSGVRIYMHHEPMPWSHWKAQADMHLCGHVHEAWKTKNTSISGPTVNVGVDQWGYRPVSLSDLLASIRSP